VEENRPDVLFLTVVSELVQRASSGRGNPVITKLKNTSAIWSSYILPEWPVTCDCDRRS